MWMLILHIESKYAISASKIIGRYKRLMTANVRNLRFSQGKMSMSLIECR